MPSKVHTRAPCSGTKCERSLSYEATTRPLVIRDGSTGPRTTPLPLPGENVSHDKYSASRASPRVLCHNIMKPFIGMMLFVALQEMVDTSFSNEEHGNIKSADKNDELLSQDDRGSHKFCENNEQCKVRNCLSIISPGR